MSATATNTPIPTEWPDVISQQYSPIRILGKGGFASVMLAKVKSIDLVSKNVQEYCRNGTTSSGIQQQKDCNLVAIKVAGNPNNKELGGGGSVTRSELAYGHREIDILQALSHPNIMQCLDYVDPTPGKGMILVLSYAKGPTVESLLKHGGAFSNLFGRVVIAQLVDAVAYLHSHAVVHRDIKPDNIIVTGATSAQAEIWDNPDDHEDPQDPRLSSAAPSSSVAAANAGDTSWKALRDKWHVTLIDFGFARALTPQDVTKPSLEYRRENMDASFHATKMDIELVLNMDTSTGSRKQRSSSTGLNLSSHSGQNSSRHSLVTRRNSFSNMLHRQMSALGSPQFAAPEIKRVQQRPKTLDKSGGGDTYDGDITHTISSFVADYGLLVDAYSLGCTIRYMMTGCPPHVSVGQAIREQNNIVDQLCGLLCVPKKKKPTNSGSGNTAGATSPAHRTPRFRYVEDLPGEVQRLIRQLTQPDEKDRTSVRAARRYHWIQDVLTSDKDDDDEDVDDNDDDEKKKKRKQQQTKEMPIQYLDFARHHKQRSSGGDVSAPVPELQQEEVGLEQAA